MNIEIGKIISIEEVTNKAIQPISQMDGSGGRLGMMQMINILGGYQSMDGYEIKTEKSTVFVLIDNGQSCCESWGYFSSEDNLNDYVGALLKEVKLTDVALNVQKVEKSDYYDDEGGIQFVDFVTDKGTFQLAVYNSHNGYYGHGIVVAIDSDVLINDTL